MTTSDNFGQGDQPPQYGQPQYGQPQYGQPQYGQDSQFGQPGQFGQQPQYGQPGQFGPPGVPVARQRNGFAIASLVCAIAQIILFILPLLALSAIILGVVGISRAGKLGGTGRGMAITGLILGCLGMIFFLLAVVGSLAVQH